MAYTVFHLLIIDSANQQLSHPEDNATETSASKTLVLSVYIQDTA